MNNIQLKRKMHQLKRLRAKALVGEYTTHTYEQLNKEIYRLYDILGLKKPSEKGEKE